jgi:hypothetical protein
MPTPENSQSTRRLPPHRKDQPVTGSEIPSIDQYLDRNRDGRIAARIDAVIAYDALGRRAAALYAAEVALAVREDFPTATRLRFTADQDEEGPSIKVVEIAAAAGAVRWSQADEGDPDTIDYNDDSTVRDLLAAVAALDRDYSHGGSLHLAPTPTGQPA